MIYVIEQLINGEWTHLRRDNGMPVMYSSRRTADDHLMILNRYNTNRRHAYRVTPIRD